MYGARYSLIIAFAASILNLVIGVLYGGIAGFLGGKVDNIMMRIVDILYSIPTLIYVVLLMQRIKDGRFKWNVCYYRSNGNFFLGRYG